MKAHLIKTTNFSPILYDEILTFLSQFSSPIEFVRGESTSEILLKDRFNYLDAFGHCRHYRSEKSLPDEDAVVILTSNVEADNWFSHYDLKGNIFVVAHDISDGVKFIEKKYFCAYEIVCNILQNAMQLDVRIMEHEKYIHKAPQGCMNDFCATKSQIILKFRTAEICPSCYNYAKTVGVKTPLILQIKAIAEKISSNVKTVPELDVNDLSNIVYDKNNQSIYLKDSGMELGLNNQFH